MNNLGGIVEVIKEGEIVRVSARQALEEDLFILRKVLEPEREYISESFDKKSSSQPKKGEEVKSYSRLTSWKYGKLDINKNNVLKELVENFHWQIIRTRRSKGIGRKELATAIGISDEDMKSIEFGELPKDNFIIISKIENKLGISLRKEKKTEGPSLSQLQKVKEDKFRESNSDANSLLGEDLEIID